MSTYAILKDTSHYNRVNTNFYLIQTGKAKGREKILNIPETKLILPQKFIVFSQKYP